jgi:hypothetical protein
MRFAVRGGRKTILSEAAPAPRFVRTDNALFKALALAHRWRARIENGEYGSITELAKAERVNESYACRLLRLTLLAPRIITDILNGRQLHEVTLKQLTKPFPLNWDDQFALEHDNEHGSTRN